MIEKLYSTLAFLFGLFFAGPAGYIIRRNAKKKLSFKLDINHQTPEEAVNIISDISKILEK